MNYLASAQNTKIFPSYKFTLEVKTAAQAESRGATVEVSTHRVFPARANQHPVLIFLRFPFPVLFLLIFKAHKYIEINLFTLSVTFEFPKF